MSTDIHGLETLSRSWNPRSMRSSGEGAAFLDAVNSAIADVLNPLIDLEMYLPILLNPTRCLDNDINAILAMNGIQRARSFSPSQARRLAVIAASLRSWRGSFLSLRSVVGALTGGPVVIRSWLVQRVSLDESSWDIVIFTDSGYQDTTQVFLLGQGNSEYDQNEVETHVESLARAILDTTEYISCFTLTAWRDGFAGWQVSGKIELVPSSIFGEFECIDMGIAVDGSGAVHRVTAPGEHDSDTTKLWCTVWFKTVDATTGSSWDLLLASDGDSSPTAYAARVNVGNGTLELIRLDAGVSTVLGTHAFTISDGDGGSWHRLDVIFTRQVGQASLRVYIDHDPSGWAVDFVMSPVGTKIEIIVDDTRFVSGKLKIAAITAKQG